MYGKTGKQRVEKRLFQKKNNMQKKEATDRRNPTKSICFEPAAVLPKKIFSSYVT